MKGLTVKIGADTSKFTKGLNDMQSKSSNTASSIKSSMAKMFAGGLVVGGLRNLINDLDRAGKLAQRFSTSAVTIQKLGTVAELNGTNFERMAKGLTEANRAAEESLTGNKRAADALEAMGINAEEFLHMGLQDQLLAISEGYIKADETSQAYASSQIVLGGSAKELKTLLKQGSETITAQADAASAASDKTVDAVQAMNDKWTMAKNKALGYGIAVAETMAKIMPILVRVKDAIQSTINWALETGIALVGGLIKTIKALLDKDWQGAFDAMAEGGDGITKAFTDRLDAVGENNKKMFDSLAAAELKAKLEVIDKVEKREEQAAKKKEATTKRIEALKTEGEKNKAKPTKSTPERFKVGDVKGLKPLSSMASVGGGGNGSFSFQSLTKAAMKTNELLQQVANNTAKPQTARLA